LNNKWLIITWCISKTLHSITYSDHIYQMQWKCRCDLPLVSRYSQSYMHVPINLNVKFPIMIRPTSIHLTRELVAFIRNYVTFKIYLHSLVPKPNPMTLCYSQTGNIALAQLSLIDNWSWTSISSLTSSQTQQRIISKFSMTSSELRVE
jgi:hypothetical protein